MDDEPTYGDLLKHLMEAALREATFQSESVTDLSPELAVAALIRAWRSYRTDQVIGIDELEIGLSLANGSPAGELTPDRTIGEQRLRDVVGPTAVQQPSPQPRRGLFRAE